MTNSLKRSNKCFEREILAFERWKKEFKTEAVEFEVEEEEMMCLKEILDELLYRSYAHNRSTSPEVEWSKWRSIFGDAVKSMEDRFQRENFPKQYYDHAACMDEHGNLLPEHEENR